MAISTSATAAGDAILSCYGSRLTAPVVPMDKEIFVIIDQTTQFDNGLKQSVANQIRPFLTAGNGFTVLIFSAFTQGNYTQVLTSGQLDHALPTARRNDVSKPLLAKFDQCISRQTVLAGQAVGSALRAAFEGSSDDIHKSDVLASLKDISGKVRQSRATSKIVLLASDMLENSSFSSFYAKKTVRRIDPEREIKLAGDNQLMGDFGSARIYVMGAGLLSEAATKNKAAYRDPRAMQALTGFWTTYFNQSKSQLIEFGQPALLNQVK